MKKLSKIIALLLAGAMAMVMLTACTGGNGPNTPGNSEEQKMMEKITSSEQGKGIKGNDPGLYQTALSDLNADFKTQSEKGGKFKGELRVKGTDPAEKYVTITVTANYRSSEFITSLLKFISDNIGRKYPDTNVDFSGNSSWSKAAVVVRSNEYGTYVAVAIQVRNLNYPKT